MERTVLRPGEIELHLRNDGADPVRVEQAIVNDAFAAFTQTDEEIGRLAAGRGDGRVPVDRGPGLRGHAAHRHRRPRSTHSIDAAVESPDADVGFYGLMALIGLYVGVIPVAIGMLWLPWVRTMDARWMRFILAFTVGLLTFLGIDALLEGTELAGEGAAGPRRRRTRVAGRGGGVPRAGRRGRLAQRAPRARGRRGRRGGARRARGLPGRARDRPAQPRRGARDRLRLRGRLARARARRWWSGSRSTTPPRASPSWPRSRARARARPRTLVLLGRARRSAGDPGRLDRRLGVQPQPGGAHVRHRRRRDRPGDRPDRASDARSARGAGSLPAWPAACCSAWS